LPGMPGGPLQSRAQALSQLRQVADFFRRTEPHSPVAYLAEKAANWGELPLHLWLRSVVKDAAAIAQLEELLGTQKEIDK
ncbi:MAG TPA: type VI secretion system protein TssA, partial [Janthinobacterium sp.]|nr:type VI secretion system protein TssA [Janthinobacterium sp.]